MVDAIEDYFYAREDQESVSMTVTSHEVDTMRKDINDYHQRNGKYPVVQDFSEFRKIFPVNQNILYHYAYESDGSSYILAYPQIDSVRPFKVECKVESSANKGEISVTVVNASCDSVLQPRK